MNNDLKELDQVSKYSLEIEGQFFDRKSARIEPREIAKHLSAFANADGGTLVIGIEDNGEISGFKHARAHEIDDYRAVPYTFMRSHPTTSFILLHCQNSSGIDDVVLVIDIEPVSNGIVELTNDEVYLRIADSSKKLNHSDVERLKLDKGVRIYEDGINERATFEDLDFELVNDFCRLSNHDAHLVSVFDVLEARSFTIKNKITNACVVVFAKDPSKFCPNYGVRFIRYDGQSAHTGERINIIKDEFFTGPIIKVLDLTINFIKSQLREFNSFDNVTNSFKTVTEYPEAAWVEGVVNAVTHRDYSILGDHIRITMFDDRLEIHSPGKLPNIVNLSNMRNTRYSRNPRIARVLNTFGKVKELNEGVKRIYEEMQRYFLKDPVYSEPNNNSVLLVLENNIVARNLRKTDKVMELLIRHKKDINKEAVTIISALTFKSKINVKEASDLINRSNVYTIRILKNLTKIGILVWNGTSTNDPTQFYTLKE